MNRASRAALLALTAVSAPLAAAAANDFAAALDARWDYDRPALSELRFRAELAKWPPGSAQAAEAATQLARALGLQQKYGEAHAVLDGIELRLPTLPAHVRTRYLLERGRTFNSSGSAARAVPLFAAALALAEANRDDFCAIDAAHMLGIAAPAAERTTWNRKALSLAEATTDRRARDWRASLYNNLGWSSFDDGDAKGALECWRKALALRETMGDPGRTRLARWTVARGLRAVGRLDEAQAMQQALAVELDAIGEPDGYVFEELALISIALGQRDEARTWAVRARAALEADPSFAAGEAPRVARLAAIAAGEAPATTTP